MNQEHTATLFQKFPHLYRGRHLPLTHNLMSWGFQCGDGWFALLYQLSQQITEYAVHHPDVQQVMAVQVKEKFGTLRFYVRGADAHIEALIDAVEVQSAQLCELDGTPGRLRVRQGHYQTLCDDHARTLGAHDAAPRASAPRSPPPRGPEGGRACGSAARGRATGHPRRSCSGSGGGSKGQWRLEDRGLYEESQRLIFKNSGLVIAFFWERATGNHEA